MVLAFLVGGYLLDLLRYLKNSACDNLDGLATFEVQCDVAIGCKGILDDFHRVPSLISSPIS